MSLSLEQGFKMLKWLKVEVVKNEVPVLFYTKEFLKGKQC